MNREWRDRHAAKTLSRLMPLIQREMADSPLSRKYKENFYQRLKENWPRAFELLYELYGNAYDFFYHLQQIVLTLVRGWIERPEHLKKRDENKDPEWYLSGNVMGGSLYVDLFSKKLSSLKDHLDYFTGLGINYLHLMPFFKVSEVNSDGGYAVSSYREVDPSLGSMKDLSILADKIHEQDMHLVIDFVFNHTSDEHEWAVLAKQGNPDYQDFYYTYPDRSIPDRYEKSLRDIFPTIRRGSFTWNEEMQRWVWTTFHSYQWDLNYSNPAVFQHVMDEMIFLGNIGVDVLRLDAVPFIWKKIGTNCENLAEAHKIIRAFNRLCQIVIPSLVFKSEAIVHPGEIVKYIHPEECQISYNPLLMALLWEASATRETKLLSHSMRKWSRLPRGTTWLNYIRCHDDIGWTFDDQDAKNLGIDPRGHRHFLNDFYTGQYPGSFARGMPFQFDYESGDVRISGTLASLAGLEQAIQKNDHDLIQFALKRMFMLWSVILSMPGIPLIFLGEEWGALNDYSYVANPVKHADSRWIHRTKMIWEELEKWRDPERIESKIYNTLVHLISLFKKCPAMGGNQIEVIETGNQHLFGYIRHNNSHRMVILANFSEQEQPIQANRIRVCGLGYTYRDVIKDVSYKAEENILLEPYQAVWLEGK